MRITYSTGHAGSYNFHNIASHHSGRIFGNYVLVSQRLLLQVLSIGFCGIYSDLVGVNRIALSYSAQYGSAESRQIDVYLACSWNMLAGNRLSSLDDRLLPLY